MSTNEPRGFWKGVAAMLGLAAVTGIPVQAQQPSASAQAILLEEIVVTSRRREENLQDLPMSVQAIGADAMQVQGIYGIKDITEFIPNVAFRSQDRRDRVAIFIRGIGSGDTGSLNPVGAAVYFDGHYLPDNNNQAMSTLDIERMEVLRGPQGTLFGKNATGGAIQIISAKPGADFESEILLRAADFGQQDLRGMLNLPINDTVSTRFAFAKETSDGFWFNRTLNRDYGGVDIAAISAAVRFTPNDNWLIDFSFRGNYEKDDQLGGQCRARPTQGPVDNLAREVAVNGEVVHPAQIYTGPVYEDGVGQWGGGHNFGQRGGNDVVTINGMPPESFGINRRSDGRYRINFGGHVERLYPGAVIDFWNACNTDNALGDFVHSSEKIGFVHIEQEFYQATIEWDSAGEIGAFDNLNARLIAGRSWNENNRLADRDFTPLSIDSIGNSPHLGEGSERATESVELLFSGDVNDRLSFVAGTHWFEDHYELGEQNCLKATRANFAALADPTSGFTIECSPDGATQFGWLGDRQILGGPGVNGMSGYGLNESIAVFGQVTYDLNENWTLDFGARWTEEDRAVNTLEMPTVPGTCTHQQPGDPPPTQLCAPIYLLTNKGVFEDGTYADASDTFTATTPMISLTRRLAGGDTLDSGIVYFLISEGFLSGAFNDELNVVLTPQLAPLLSILPEHVTNYEVGFKGALADGRLRLAASVFYMDYTDKQEVIFIDNSDSRFGADPRINLIANAASVDISGVELELSAQPWNGGLVSLAVGYLSNEFGEFTSFDPNAPGGIVDLSDLRIQDFSPEWTITGSIEHPFVLGNGATLTPHLGMYYQDDFEWRGGLENDPPSLCFQEAYATFRTRVTYDPPDGNWQASLFGVNIGDKRYFAFCDHARTGVFDYRYGRPATWGLEFVHRWGDN